MAKIVKKEIKVVEEVRPVLTKDDLIVTVMDQLDMSKAKAKETFDSVIGTISDAIEEGSDVSIHGFGIFSVKNTNERMGRNPATGEEVLIPAGKKLSFKISSVLKKKVTK
jgi:nucleoid DNA-binding protein